MDNTILFVIIGAVVVAAIFWLVIYSRKRGRRHVAETSIRPPDSRVRTGPVDR
jgi:energy-converting hydrogenase Eha subunit A